MLRLVLFFAFISNEIQASRKPSSALTEAERQRLVGPGSFLVKPGMRKPKNLPPLDELERSEDMFGGQGSVKSGKSAVLESRIPKSTPKLQREAPLIAIESSGEFSDAEYNSGHKFNASKRKPQPKAKRVAFVEDDVLDDRGSDVEEPDWRTTARKFPPFEEIENYMAVKQDVEERTGMEFPSTMYRFSQEHEEEQREAQVQKKSVWQRAKDWWNGTK